MRQLAQLEYRCGRTDISCLVKAGRENEGRVVLHVREQLRCMKLNGTDNRLVEFLWFRNRGGTSKGNRSCNPGEKIKSSLNNSVSVYITDPGSC